MLLGTEVPMEDETSTVPVEATAKGRIGVWFRRPEERDALGERIVLDEGEILCAIVVKENGFPEFEHVRAPITGHLVKIIKDVDALVTERETIGRMRPISHPAISPELYPFIG